MTIARLKNRKKYHIISPIQGNGKNFSCCGVCLLASEGDEVITDATSQTIKDLRSQGLLCEKCDNACSH